MAVSMKRTDPNSPTLVDGVDEPDHTGLRRRQDRRRVRRMTRRQFARELSDGDHR